MTLCLTDRQRQADRQTEWQTDCVVRIAPGSPYVRVHALDHALVSSMLGPHEKKAEQSWKGTLSVVFDLPQYRAVGPVAYLRVFR